MTTIIIRCIKNFGKFPDSMIIHQQKEMKCFLFRQYKGQFNLSRNMLTTAADVTKDNKTSATESPIKVWKMYNYINKEKWLKKSVIENILKHIKTSGDLHSKDIFLLINSCDKVVDCLPSEKIDLLEYLWSVLFVCDVKVNVEHYNVLLQIYIENDHDFSPKKLLAEMNYRRIQPNKETYEKCIECCSKKREVSEALELIKHMKHQGFPITEAIYNSLILGYSLLGEIENITKCLISMKQNKIKPSAKTYTALLCGYAKQNDINEIENIIRSSSRDIHFSNENILNIIYMLLKNNHGTHVKNMYKYLKKSRSLSNKEINLILKLINIRQMYVAANVFLHMYFKTNDISEYVKVLQFVVQNIVYNSSDLNEIVKLCNFIEDNRMCEDPLLMALYSSYLRQDDQLCLPLLELCKNHYVIKPHYFWPILIKKAAKYDYQGILNTLQVMINKFNIVPCIDTMTDYVLPFSFAKPSITRKMLITHRVNETIVNNAYILLLLRMNKTYRAITYMKNYSGPYFYNIVEHDLRKSLIHRRDVDSFVQISVNLKEHNSTSDEESFVFVPMEKQLLDFMIYCPSYKVLLAKVILYLVHEGVKLSPAAAIEIVSFLNELATKDVKQALEKMSSKILDKNIY